MKIPYFSVYDKKAQQFGVCFGSQTPGSAERSFDQSIKTPDSPHAAYPSDYALYRVFDFDDESGYVVETYEPPQLVCEGSALVKS